MQGEMTVLRVCRGKESRKENRRARRDGRMEKWVLVGRAFTIWN